MFQRRPRRLAHILENLPIGHLPVLPSNRPGASGRPGRPRSSSATERSDVLATCRGDSTITSWAPQPPGADGDRRQSSALSARASGGVGFRIERLCLATGLDGGKLVRHDPHAPMRTVADAGGFRRRNLRRRIRARRVAPSRKARTSGGVSRSCPSQNGQDSAGSNAGDSMNAPGRSARPAAMITQWSRIGSFRRSDMVLENPGREYRIPQ